VTKNTVSEIERMVVTRVFDAPRELVWKAWTDPKYVMQWWDRRLYCARLPDGFSRWGKISLLHEDAGRAGVLELVEYHEIVPYEKIVSSMYFSDSKGNKVSLWNME